MTISARPAALRWGIVRMDRSEKHMSNRRMLASVVTFFAVTATLNAQQQSLVQAQKETMAAERTIAMAWEGFAVDNNTYTPGDPKSGITSEGRGPGDELHWSRYVQINFDYVRSLLEPKYIRSLPRTDGWGNPFQFAVHLANGISDQYVIRSLGADGTADGDGSYVRGATTSPNADIVYTDGEFATYPKGVSIAPPSRPLTELNELKPLDHVVALLEESGYKYAKTSDSTWKFEFKMTTVPSMEVYIVYREYLLLAFVYIGDQKQLKLDADKLRTLLRYNDEIDVAKVALEEDGRVVYRVEAPLRTVDEEQFRYMLTQVSRGADGLIGKLLPAQGRTSS
jgi:hypothetical protein